MKASGPPEQIEIDTMCAFETSIMKISNKINGNASTNFKVWEILDFWEEGFFFK